MEAGIRVLHLRLPMVIGGSKPLILFFDVQLVLGLGIDAILLWVVLTRAWAA